MTEETQAHHYRDYANMKEFLEPLGHDGDDDLHAKVEHQLSTAEIGSVGKGARLGKDERIVGAHHPKTDDAGRYAVREHDAGADLVNGVAAAWDGGHGDQQHTLRSTYTGTGDGAHVIESKAAAKNHRTDGRILLGGMNQVFLPEGLWLKKDEPDSRLRKGLRKVDTNARPGFTPEPDAASRML